MTSPSQYIPRSLRSLKYLIHQSAPLFLNWLHQASILWFDVDLPYIKLLSPAKQPFGEDLKNRCIAAICTFSVPQSARTMRVAPLWFVEYNSCNTATVSWDRCLKGQPPTIGHDNYSHQGHRGHKVQKASIYHIRLCAIFNLGLLLYIVSSLICASNVY